MVRKEAGGGEAEKSLHGVMRHDGRLLIVFWLSGTALNL